MHEHMLLKNDKYSLHHGCHALKQKNKKEEGIKGKSVVKTSSVKYNLKKSSSYIKQNNKHENGNDKRINH